MMRGWSGVILNEREGSITVMGKSRKKIKAVICWLLAISYKLIILLRLNHYDKRVSSIALRTPASSF